MRGQQHGQIVGIIESVDRWGVEVASHTVTGIIKAATEFPLCNTDVRTRRTV
jgi:hypothetical protein